MLEFFSNYKAELNRNMSHETIFLHYFLEYVIYNNMDAV